jgi:hypothetical protein
MIIYMLFCALKFPKHYGVIRQDQDLAQLYDYLLCDLRLLASLLWSPVSSLRVKKDVLDAP